MQFIFYIPIFIFGLLIGSFLNCVIYRLGCEKSFTKGRSFCPSCKHSLSWLDLVPLLSYLTLGGRCRYCKKTISAQYPLVELATAFLFVFLFSPGDAIKTIYLFIIISLSVIISVFDLRHYIIPDKVVFPAIAISLLYDSFLLLAERISFGEFLGFVCAGAVSALFFFLVFFLSQGKWMGFGDVKLVLFMGLFLGFPKILVALFLAFMFGGIIGLGLVIFRNKNIRSEVPFGPFLISGMVLSLFIGTNLINWYLSLLII